MFKDLNEFIAALDKERELARITDAVSPDLEDGWRSLEVVLAAEESARSGRRVVLRETGTLAP